jgi:hypothetical protein
MRNCKRFFYHQYLFFIINMFRLFQFLHQFNTSLAKSKLITDFKYNIFCLKLAYIFDIYLRIVVMCTNFIWNSIMRAESYFSKFTPRHTRKHPHINPQTDFFASDYISFYIYLNFDVFTSKHFRLILIMLNAGKGKYLQNQRHTK